MTTEEKRKYWRERYYRLKEEGMCVKCGHKEAISGQTLCSVCKAEMTKTSKQRYQKHKEERKQYARTYFREKYTERLEKGMCVRCGKRPPKENCTRCEICLDVARKDTHKRTVRKRELAKQGEKK